jgi:hypothetical protein
LETDVADIATRQRKKGMGHAGEKIWRRRREEGTLKKDKAAQDRVLGLEDRLAPAEAINLLDDRPHHVLQKVSFNPRDVMSYHKTGGGFTSATEIIRKGVREMP